MSISNYFSRVDFGAAQGGLSTVGYELRDVNNSVVVSRTTTGVVEIVTNSGSYGVKIPTIANNVAFVVWDTGGGSPVYQTINLQDVLDERSAAFADGAQWLDYDNGSDSNIGSADRPVQTLAQAITNAKANDQRVVKLKADTATWLIAVAASQDLTGLEYHGEGANHPFLNIPGINTINWGDCVFRNVGFGNTQNWNGLGYGAGFVYFFDSEIAGLNTGTVASGDTIMLTCIRCDFNGSTIVKLCGNGTYIMHLFDRCLFGDLRQNPGTVFDLQNEAGWIVVRNSNGRLVLRNVPATANVIIELASGSLELEATVDASRVTVWGSCEVINNGTGSFVDKRQETRIKNDLSTDHGSGIWEGTTPAAIDSVLSAAHGSGAWDGTEADWTVAEREQIRSALGIDGDKTDATGGQLQTSLAAILLLVEDAGGRWEITDTGGGQLDIYESDNATLLYSFELYDENGNRTDNPAAVAKRVRIP